MAKRYLLLLVCIISSGSLTQIEAQTTLSGDHVVDGNLNVGNSVNRKDMLVTGGASIGSNFSLSGLQVRNYSSSPILTLANNSGEVQFLVGTSLSFEPTPLGSISFVGGKVYVKYGGNLDEWGGVVTEDNSSSMELSGGIVDGWESVAMTGGYVDYSGMQATAMSGGFAYAASSTAMGGGFASGTSSTAISGGVTTGRQSVAMGAGYATSFQSVVIGGYNVYSEENDNANQWVTTDPLFIIGNGTQSTPHNAFTVFKNGKIKMDRQGDIAMGDFGAPGSGD